MSRKRMLVDVDENQWAALKGQAEVEGRFVRVLLAEALAAYLTRATQAAQVPVDTTPGMDLRTLVELASKPATWADKIGTKPKDRQFLSDVAERQAYLRDHPEDEQQ